MMTPAMLMKRHNLKRVDEDDFGGADSIYAALYSAQIPPVSAMLSFFMRGLRPAAVVVHTFATRAAELAEMLRSRGYRTELIPSWASGAQRAVLVHVE